MKIHTLRGQTILITVLVLTIALTVALSLIRRTTTDVKTAGQLQESARAFSAAEAGIEDVLKRAAPFGAILQGDGGSARFDTTYTTIAGTSAVYTYPVSTEKGDVATVWLVPHLGDNTLDESGEDSYCETAGACDINVCWDQPTSPIDKPAVEIGILYKPTASSYDIQRFAYDPEVTHTGNNFNLTEAQPDGCGKTGNYWVKVTLPTGLPIALRLRPYYNSTIFSLSPLVSRVIPAQGFEVSSTGKTDSGVTRKIVVKKKYDAPASMFDYVLYANEKISNEAY